MSDQLSLGVSEPVSLMSLLQEGCISLSCVSCAIAYLLSNCWLILDTVYVSNQFGVGHHSDTGRYIMMFLQETC